MSYIRVVVVLLLLNGAYCDMSKRDSTSSGQVPASVLSVADKQLEVLLNNQVATDEATQPNSDSFYDHFMQLDNIDIDLHNLTIENYVGRIDTVEPRLANQYLKVYVEWSNLAIKGSCTVVNKEPIIPIYSSGNIEIIFKKPVAKVDTNLAVEENNLKTWFVNLDFNAIPDSVNAIFTVPSEDASTIVSKLSTPVLNNIKGDLGRALEHTLQDQLDQLLSGITLQDIFSKNADDAAKYKATNDEMQNFLLESAKLYLQKLIEKIKEEGMTVVDIPPQYIETPGTFCDTKLNLRKGTLKNMATLQLNSDSVGYKYVNGSYFITVNLGLKVFQIFFKLEDSKCGWVSLNGKVYIKIPSRKNNAKLTINVKFIKRGDNIFALVLRVLIVSVTTNDIDIEFDLDSIAAQTYVWIMRKSITERVKEGFEKELPARAQPELDKQMPKEFPADELKDGVDKNLIVAEEESGRTT